MDIVFHVAQILQIVAGFNSAILDKLANVDALSLDVPAFVIVARNEGSLHAFPFRPMLNEVIDLPLHTMGENVVLVERSFPVDHVSQLVNLSDFLFLPEIEQGVKNIHTGIAGTEMIIGGQPEADRL